MIAPSFPISKESKVYKLQQRVMQELQEDSNKACISRPMSKEEIEKYGGPTPGTSHISLDYKERKTKCKKNK